MLLYGSRRVNADFKLRPLDDLRPRDCSSLKIVLRPNTQPVAQFNSINTSARERLSKTQGKRAAAEQPSSPRKRQRTTNQSTRPPAPKRQTKSKPSRVVGLVDMPIKVFTQIASSLDPIDRSSVEIWRGSMQNVLGLPDCPSDMSEPRYLALTFLKTCT
ncbi:hypothetical protein RhiJN_08593 [Ceratobasidium sp. AG-Ba]|nr:hypothetical protein RhiJN_08593 [Ceratobasidium sp. AG-Ba]